MPKKGTQAVKLTTERGSRFLKRRMRDPNNMWQPLYGRRVVINGGPLRLGSPDPKDRFRLLPQRLSEKPTECKSKLSSRCCCKAGLQKNLSKAGTNRPDAKLHFCKLRRSQCCELSTNHFCLICQAGTHSWPVHASVPFLGGN